MEHFLQGPLAFLRPVQETDIPVFAKWINDPEVTYFMFFGQYPKTEAQVQEHFARETENQANAIFTILDKKSARPIGFAGLYDIHQTARKAELKILIGEKKFWGKGYGTQVTELLTFYGFDRLNLHRIYLGFTAENKGGMKAYQKAGFREEGVLRDDIYRNSRYYDSIRMAILREEYYKSFYPAYQKKFGVKRKA